MATKRATILQKGLERVDGVVRSAVGRWFDRANVRRFADGSGTRRIPARPAQPILRCAYIRRNVHNVIHNDRLPVVDQRHLPRLAVANRALVDRALDLGIRHRAPVIECVGKPVYAGLPALERAARHVEEPGNLVIALTHRGQFADLIEELGPEGDGAAHIAVSSAAVPHVESRGDGAKAVAWHQLWGAAASLSAG